MLFLSVMWRRWIKRRVCALLVMLFVVGTYFFGMRPPPPFIKYPWYPNDVGQLRHWPFLGGKPVRMGTRYCMDLIFFTPKLALPTFILRCNTWMWEETQCEQPKLQVINSDVLPYYHPHPTVECHTLFNNRRRTKFVGAFVVNNGSNLHQLINMNLTCCYRSIVIVDPSEGVTRYLGSCQVIRNNVTVIPSDIDYIEVLCTDETHQILYHDGFPLVHPPPKLKNKTQEIINSRLNIIIIGLDATSRLNFHRFMPLSQKYLLSPEMSAITLHGYSIVGQASRPNMFSMLSGLPYDKLEQKCYHRNGNWNNCSEWIWEKASKRGYITNYAEDMQVFIYHYSRSFVKPPTDYYLWPFAVQMKKNRELYYPSPLYFCLGKRLGFQVLLNFAQSISQVAQQQDRPHFQFLWAGELSHDALNSLSLGDGFLVDALKKWKDTGVVNNTVIMILGDHGSSLSDYFRTPSGFIEYRLPVAHIVLPPWFKTKYPREYSNMVENSHKRTTPFDIFETMMDIMDLGLARQPDREKGHGISLFQSIPERRYCNESGIPLKWCIVCHPKIPLNTSDPLVKSAAEAVVDKINSLAEDRASHLCQKLGLLKVATAHAWHPIDVDMELCNKNASEPCTSLDNEQTNVNRVGIVNLVLTTDPNATFLAEVKMIWTNNTSLKLMPDIIETSSDFDVAMRVDRYAETGHCAKPELKPFCICKKSS